MGFMVQNNAEKLQATRMVEISRLSILSRESIGNLHLGSSANRLCCRFCILYCLVMPGRSAVQSGGILPEASNGDVIYVRGDQAFIYTPVSIIRWIGDRI